MGITIDINYTNPCVHVADHIKKTDKVQSTIQRQIHHI